MVIETGSMRQKAKPVKTDGLVETSQGNSFRLFPEEMYFYVPLFTCLFVPLSTATLPMLSALANGQRTQYKILSCILCKEIEIVGREQ